jgi:hypothetical protein
MGRPDDVFRLRVDGDRHGDTGHPPSAEDVLRVERGLRESCGAIVSVGSAGERYDVDEHRVACEEALRWLGIHGNEDLPGGWDAEGSLRRCENLAFDRPLEGAGAEEADLQVTALALLAFLGRCYTNRGKHPYARVISRALRRLKYEQGVDGCYGPSHASSMPLTHALGTLAMVEAYANTGSPLFRRTLENALLFLPRALERGWNDPRVLGVCAVTVGSIRMHVDERRVRGQPVRISEPAGFADELLHALGTVRGVPAGLELGCRVLLGSEVPVPLADALDEDPSDPWTAWLTGLGLFRLRGDAWDAWLRAVRPRLLAAQRFDGSSCCYRGSWDPPDALADLGRVGMTALAVRILEVRDEVHWHYQPR